MDLCGPCAYSAHGPQYYCDRTNVSTCVLACCEYITWCPHGYSDTKATAVGRTYIYTVNAPIYSFISSSDGSNDKLRAP